MAGQAVRRSITVNSDLNARIHQFMALAGQCGVNLDYTKTMNLFGEVGALWLAESKMSERGEAPATIISKYIDYDKLEEDIIVDWESLRNSESGNLQEELGSQDTRDTSRSSCVVAPQASALLPCLVDIPALASSLRMWHLAIHRVHCRLRRTFHSCAGMKAVRTSYALAAFSAETSASIFAIPLCQVQCTLDR